MGKDHYNNISRRRDIHPKTSDKAECFKVQQRAVDTQNRDQLDSSEEGDFVGNQNLEAETMENSKSFNTTVLTRINCELKNNMLYGYSPEGRIVFKYPENSPQAQQIFKQAENERQRSVTPHGNNPQRSHSNLQSEPDQIPNNSNYKSIILFSLMICSIGLGYNYYNTLEIPNPGVVAYKSCKFNRLMKRYPLEENDLWTSLKYGIEDIINVESPMGPSVFLFLRNKNSKTNNIVEDIADLTASCFDSDLEPITLKKDDFNTHDYGIAIAKYKKDIHDGGVLVVMVNLNEVPGEAARALHTICDKYSPIVKKVVIFLSLVIDPVSTGLPVEIAENTLRELWRSSLSKNELDPLIVRVSDTVFHLQS